MNSRPAISGRQEAGFTQPRASLLAQLCIEQDLLSLLIARPNIVTAVRVGRDKFREFNARRRRCKANPLILQRIGSDVAAALTDRQEEIWGQFVRRPRLVENEIFRLQHCPFIHSRFGRYSGATSGRWNDVRSGRLLQGLSSSKKIEISSICCILSSLNDPGTETPLSHPYWKLEEFPFFHY